MQTYHILSHSVLFLCAYRLNALCVIITFLELLEPAIRTMWLNSNSCGGDCNVACAMLHVQCCMCNIAFVMLHVQCCMCNVACAILHVQCCRMLEEILESRFMVKKAMKDYKDNAVRILLCLLKTPSEMPRVGSGACISPV